MGRHYPQLDLTERRKLEKFLEAGFSKTEIAEKLGRHRSTIFREVRRNYFSDVDLPGCDGYYCTTADAKAKQRRGSRRKLVLHQDLRTAVFERLKSGWAPEQIAGRLRLEDSPKRVCHETI